MSRVTGFFIQAALFSFFTLLLATSPALANSDSEDTEWEPHYSHLFNQLLKLEGEGHFLQALRLIPEVYAAEDIPVDSFYLTLDKKRSKLLTKITTQDIAFKLGKEKVTCASLVSPFSDLFIGQVGSYHFKTPVVDDLEFERFCYLLAVEGIHQDTLNLITPASSEFDLKQALKSSDPWLVSASLFFGRKQKNSTIAADEIIARWQKRPDLWDDQCTQQALLFLAQLDSEALKKLKVSNEDIVLTLEELEPVASGKSYISTLLFSSVANDFSYLNNQNMKLIKLEEKRQKQGMVKRWAGDKNQFSNLEPVSEKKITADDYEDGVIAVEPGFYRIKFNSVKGIPPSGYYGKSSIVEVHGGEFIIVPITVVPAI